MHRLHDDEDEQNTGVYIKLYGGNITGCSCVEYELGLGDQIYEFFNDLSFISP
jgi:hypothetical protein